MPVMRLICACVVLAAATVAPGRSLIAAGNVPSFRGGVDLVALNVTVLDPKDKFVSGLDESRFHVMEDGIPQELSFFSSGSVPIDLALLIDASASVREQMPSIHEAAIGFLKSLRPTDRASVVAIKSRPTFVQALTTDRPALEAAVRSTASSGSTALYDALYLTLREFTRERREAEEVRRQAIIVLSDGEDTSSLVGYDDLLAQIRQSGVSIYTISMKPISDAMRLHDYTSKTFGQAGYVMHALAQETGGRTFAPAQLRELNGVYANIADELASQYAMAYIPKNSRQDGSYRHITVQIAMEGVRARTRLGYLAPGRAMQIAALAESTALRP